MDYDIIIAYRTHPYFSKAFLSIKELFNFKNKYELFHACLLSLKESTKNLKIKMLAILDGCPAGYQETFREHFSDVEIFNVNFNSNINTFIYQIKLLDKFKKTEIIMFHEDDYFYINKLKYALDFMLNNPRVDVVSPELQYSIIKSPWIKFVKNTLKVGAIEWIEIPSTPLTFLCKTSYLSKAKEYLTNYGFLGDLRISLLSTKNIRLLRPDLPFYRYRIGTLLDLIKYNPSLLLIYLKSKASHFWMPNPTFAIHLNPVSINQRRISLINDKIKNLLNTLKRHEYNSK